MARFSRTSVTPRGARLIRPILVIVVSMMLATSLEGFRPTVEDRRLYTEETITSPNVDLESLGDRSASTNTARPFMRPHRTSMRRNCTPAAIEQFPRPMMSRQTRMDGGLALNIAVAILAFFGLAIICDDYFVPSLESMCEVLHLKPDVAGATFMAAGSSAPELATSVIAVFITKDDIGVGTVVGSAVFNIMFVVGICGLWTTKALLLDWWPLSRDCFFYLISICALLYAISDEMITWYESVAFLVLYTCYCAFMFYNEEAEVIVRRLFGLSFSNAVNEKTYLVPAATYDKVSMTLHDEHSNVKSISGSVSVISVPEAPTGGPPSTQSEESLDSLALQRAEESEFSVLNYPENAFYRALWIVSLPMIVALYVTVPDCRRRRWRRWYVVTFTMSMFWLAALSYVLVWMITIIGCTLNIPDTVMGLTFLAAGVSVPDAIASLLVIKDGQGDMAVSNAIGSNVFDILLCLGFPWFLQTVIVNPNSIVPVISKGLMYSTLSLLSTVVFLLLAIAYNRWKLDRPLGAVLMVWYVLFMVLASLYEMNVFGEFNPPTCPSDY